MGSTSKEELFWTALLTSQSDDKSESPPTKRTSEIDPSFPDPKPVNSFPNAKPLISNTSSYLDSNPTNYYPDPNPTSTFPDPDPVRSYPDPFPNRYESEPYQKDPYNNTTGPSTKNHYSTDSKAPSTKNPYHTDAKAPSAPVISQTETPLDSIWKILTNQSNLKEQQAKEQQARERQAKEQAIANHNDPEVLKPGNYLFVTWDGVWWKETESKKSHLCQIAASVPNGESFMAHILPGFLK